MSKNETKKHRKQYSVILDYGYGNYHILELRENNIPTTKAYLEQIDYVFTRLKDIGEFRNKILKNNPPKDLFIVRNLKTLENGQYDLENRIEVIYGNELLHQLANVSLKRKVNNIEGNSINIDDSNIKELMNKILIFVTNSKTYSLNKLPYHLSKLFKDYLKIIENEYESLYEKNSDINQIKNQILFYLTDYKHARDTILALEKIKSHFNKNTANDNFYDNPSKIVEFYEIKNNELILKEENNIQQEKKEENNIEHNYSYARELDEILENDDNILIEDEETTLSKDDIISIYYRLESPDAKQAIMECDGDPDAIMAFLGDLVDGLSENDKDLLGIRSLIKIRKNN